MKKFKTLLTSLLILIFAVTSFGCYIVQGQKMKDVKGTYKLTRYVRTPKYLKGQTPKTTDYIADKGYEVYLVVTGSGTGYYVHKDNDTVAYSREISMSYEYNEEDSSKVEYVLSNETLLGEDTRFAITKNRLNRSLASVTYAEMKIGDLVLVEAHTSKSFDMDWEKVSKTTDLSYAKSQLGTLKEYDYIGYDKRGIYEMTTYNVDGTSVVDDPYQYYFIMIDTAKGTTTAKVYYALKTDLTPVVETVSFAANSDYTVFTIDGKTWTVDPSWGTYYYCQGTETREQIVNTNYTISEDSINQMIQSKLPATQE